MKKNLKRMGVVAALAIVAWVAVPAGADDNPAQFWDFASSFDEGLILSETFEGLSVGDPFDAGSLSAITGRVPTGAFLVANDNPDLNGNHFDGDSAGEGVENEISFDNSPDDHGAPTTGTYYIEGTVDNNIDEDTVYIGHNFSFGVWNSAHNTQYNITHHGATPQHDQAGWGWGFGPNGPAHNGPDVFDPTNPN